MIRVMVTGCGGHFMVDVLKCYKDKELLDQVGEKVELYGVTSELDPDIYDVVDEYIEVPRSDVPNYYDVLADLCYQNQIDVLVPDVESELYGLYQNRSMFDYPHGVKLSTTMNGNIFTVTNKALFLQALEKEGIRTPRTTIFWTQSSYRSAKKAVSDDRSPVVVKVLSGSGSRGIRILDDTHDYHDAFVNSKPDSKRITSDYFEETVMKDHWNEGNVYLMQEYLPGEEYSVDLLADHGEVIGMVGRRNVVLDNSIPIVSVVEDNEEAFEMSRKIVKLFELDGNIGFDFIFGEDGLIYPTECNARITATMSLLKEAGTNLALHQVFRLMDIDAPPIGKPKEGTMLHRKMVVTYERR